MSKFSKALSVVSMIGGLAAINPQQTTFQKKSGEDGEKISINTSELYAGLSYVYAKKGGSAEGGLAISIVGVYHSAVQGALWGAACGGPAGVAVGVGLGL